MACSQELACVYSSLILQDDDKDVSVDSLKTLLQKAKVDVEPYWLSIFSKAVSSIGLKDLVTNVCAGGGAGPAVAGAAAEAAPGEAKAEAKEEKKEAEEESDEDMGFGLFD